MKKGTCILSAVLVLCVAVLFSGCRAYEAYVMPGDDTGVTENKTLSDEEYLAAVPEQERYMFLSGRCNTDFPDNSEIKKISFLKINYSMTWVSIYGSVDLDAGKATYGWVSGGLLPPDEYQVCDLTDADIKAYRDAFDSTLLHDEIQLKQGFWKIAVEYKDGTCYAYQFGAYGAKRNTPENMMVSAYFDKMELDDNNRMIYGIAGY